jgi:twitching motility protein PilT
MESNRGSIMTLEALLRLAKERGASDLLVMVGDAPAVRVAGHWQRVDQTTLNKAQLEEMCASLLTTEAIETFRTRRDMDFCRFVPGCGRVRGNIHFQRDHLAMVLRLVWPDIPSADALGIPPHALEMSDCPHGLILVSGPTGSGKSTTLAAMVEHINLKRAAHIITLEDPIEFIFSNKKSIIEQREIGADTLSWQDGLRNVLRQAPDVIILGELRDLESIQIALLAAETGHLVIASVHSSTAHGAIMRMIDVFPASQIDQVQIQLSQSLRMIFAQQLIPGATAGTRVLAYEILMATPAIQNLVRTSEYEQIPNMISAGRDHGMITFAQCMRDLAQHGRIPQELVRRVEVDGGRAMKGNGHR